VRVKRLNGMDAMLLYSETPNVHTHTLKVTVVDAAHDDGEFILELFRQTLQRPAPAPTRDRHTCDRS
jgi:diacylglycerol O-acyltransferase